MQPGMMRAALGLFFGMLASGAEAGDVSTHSTSSFSLHFAGTGTRVLEVRDIDGRISVEAYDGQTVEMVVDKNISAPTETDLRRAADEVVLDIQDNAPSVGAMVRYPNAGVCGDQHGSEQVGRANYTVRYDFNVRVPRDTQLILCTINKGDIELKSTQGDFQVHSVNGRITMTDIVGSGEATTVNGPVAASFASPPRGASIFRTINGGVSVALPAETSADLRMKTFNGGLFTDFEIQPQAARTEVTAERVDGMLMYRTSGFTTIHIGAKGGAELTLESLNGDIRVLRRQP